MTDQGTQETYLLTEAAALQELREITAEFPEFCYTDSATYHEHGNVCRYADADGQPSCLIGRLIHRVLGPEAFELLRNREGLGGFTVGDHNWPAAIEFESSRLRMLLRLVQARQDSGLAWGKILDEVLLIAIDRNIHQY